MVMPAPSAIGLLGFPGSRSAWKASGVFGGNCVAVLAYSTLTIAAFHAVLMALQESRLHTRSESRGFIGTALDQLPALLTMEKLLFRMIGLGFILLSLTVLSGIVFSEQLFGKALNWDHKSVFTMLSWLLFASLLAGRRFRGWRGKTALSFTLAGSHLAVAMSAAFCTGSGFTRDSHDTCFILLALVSWCCCYRARSVACSSAPARSRKQQPNPFARRPAAGIA